MFIFQFVLKCLHIGVLDMPIDFNPNIFYINNNKPYLQDVVKTTFFNGSNVSDTFTKSVKVDNKNISSSFDGIHIGKRDFGTVEKNGETATLYTITNKNGASVELSTFGATIVSIKVPDKNGNLIDVTQGYNSVTPYEKSPIGHAGGTIGPCANKINHGKFKIGDKEYTLECNKDNGQTHSHGGKEGFDVKNWKAEVLKDGVKFTYYKKDMEGGYPANVKTSVTYKFDNDNNLSVRYEAQTDADTILNLTNHSYFNLDGEQNTNENSVMEHVVELPNSSKYTPVNELAIPTGEIKSVENTDFDFTSPKRLSEMNKLGYDQNFVVDNYDGKSLVHIAKVKSDKSGIVLDVSTDLPGFQFYTANNLGKDSQPVGKSGKKYEKHSAFCVEPQFFPDAINTFDEKPILKKGDKLSRNIVYSFSLD